MDDYSLLTFLLSSHLLIAPLGVDCKFAVTYNKKKIYCSSTLKRAWLDARTVCVAFVADIVIMGKAYPEIFSFHFSVFSTSFPYVTLRSYIVDCT